VQAGTPALPDYVQPISELFPGLVIVAALELLAHTQKGAA